MQVGATADRGTRIQHLQARAAPPGVRHMSQMPWPHRPLPEPGPDASTSWTGDAVTPADLTGLRRRLRVAVAEGFAPAYTDDDDIERLLLAFDELISNALRHGSPPARVVVNATGNGWALHASDAP